VIEVGPAQAVRPWLIRLGIAAAILAAVVIMALGAGTAAGIGEWEASLAVAVAVPLAIVVAAYPWSAVMIWFGVMPFLVVDESASVSAGIWAAHRLLVAATVVVLLVYRMLGLSRSRFNVSTVDVFVVGFIVLAYLNIFVLSNNPTRMSIALYDALVVPIGLFWLVRLVDPGTKDVRRLLVVVTAIVLVQVAVGVLSWLAPGVLPGAWLGRVGERTIGTLGGPGPYSVTLVFGGLLAIHAATEAHRALVRWALIGIAAMALVAVLLSLSRGSWLGAGLAVTGLLFLYPRMVLPTLAAGALAAVILASGPLAGQFSVLDDRLGDADTAESRLITNNAAVRMIATEPWFGFGYGNFERFDESFKVRVADLPVEEGSAHHAYLALAAENGLPALVLYLLPAAWLLMRSIQLRNFMPTDPLVNRNLVAVLWLALLGQFTVANFMDMLHSSPWGVGLWWISLGLIHAVVSRAADRRRAAQRPRLAVAGFQG
jgi:O-antigen ligase